MGRPVWAMADLVTPMAVRVAATLRIADHIVGGDDEPRRSWPRRPGADTGALDRLLRHLVTAGVLRRDDDGTVRADRSGRGAA